VLELLNRFLVEMSKVVVRHRGTIDKFMGDSIMVLFGAPEAAADDVTRAMDCAVDMQIAMAGLNRHHQQIGLPALYMGIGVNTGVVMAGLLGSELYSQYTVVGDEVNLASRIEAVSLRGQVLISEQTFRRCRDYVATGAATDVYVKGKAEPVKLYEVLGIPSAGKVLPRQELRKSPRVEAKLPFAYQVLDNGVVRPELLRASSLDIGYYGMLAEVERPLVERSEIKFELALPLINAATGQIYARVVKARQRDARHLAALEFTSVREPDAAALRRFVHLLLQGV
jgi:adenylate cyclase